jgi:hypothetical protein
VALPAVITAEQRQALRISPGVRQGRSRRPPGTDPVELEALVAERKVLDTVEKMAKSARTTGSAGVQPLTPRPSAPTWTSMGCSPTTPRQLHPARRGLSRRGKKFVRQISHGSPSMASADELEALETDPEFADIFTHDDFLAMTTPVRMVDEKILILLRSKGELIKVLAKASAMGNATASLFMRNL